MSKNRKFSQYTNVVKQLKKDQIENPGPVAGLLLGAFIFGNSMLYADNAVDRGVCKAGHFKAWRKQLTDKGWLHWSLNDGKRASYKPGQRLVKYLEKEIQALNKKKFETEELVTKSELDEVRQELRKEIQSKHEEHVKTVKKMIELLDPPDTLEKTNHYLKIVGNSEA
jgi:hypothetical protein